MSVAQSALQDAQKFKAHIVVMRQSLCSESWVAELTHWIEMTTNVISQTQRRVFHGEKVPASEKVVSIFEAHTDIVVKGSRDTQYGHKLNRVQFLSYDGSFSLLIKPFFGLLFMKRPVVIKITA